MSRETCYTLRPSFLRLRPWRPIVVAIVLLATAGCEPPAERVRETGPASGSSLVSGPASAEPPSDFIEPDLASGRTHLVQPNDTLYSLAKKYYGDPNKWRQIFIANRNRLSDPKHLPVGMRLIIP